MAVELWVGEEFNTTHEREATVRFVQKMVSHFGESDESYFVLVNYYIQGTQIDLTVLKRDAIVVIELKDFRGPFQATENGDWLSIPEGSPVGTSGLSPFKQARDRRFKWMSFLDENREKFLTPLKARNMRFDHISAFVAISPSLHPEAINELPYLPWFRLVGLEELPDAVYQQKSQYFEFADSELRTLIIDLLHLQQANAKPEHFDKMARKTEGPYSHFKEASYPSRHHFKDIDAIKRVIEIFNSLLVLGLSGSGKSSILRFLVSNRAAQSEGVAFIYIDCNILDWESDHEVMLEEVCGQIIDNLQSPNVRGLVVTSGSKQAKHVLRDLMKALSTDGPDHLVVVFDRSEVLQNELGEPFFNYLRALRDINPKLSYIFGGRNLSPESFGELVDILWNQPYWIGALSIEDAQMTISRHTTRLKLLLESWMTDKLLKCVGPHPALLKYACELIREERITLSSDEGEVISQLLGEPLIERQCRDLWQDLDYVAQDKLRRLVQALTSQLTPETRWLVDCGLLEHTQENGGIAFTSALLKGYVAGLGPPPLRMEEGIVYKGSQSLALSKEEFDLFRVLWEKQPDVVSTDRISIAVWPAAQGSVTPQMITNLVKRMRDKLSDKHYVQNVHGRGYRFVQGTAPLPRNSDVRTSRSTK